MSGPVNRKFSRLRFATRFFVSPARVVRRGLGAALMLCTTAPLFAGSSAYTFDFLAKTQATPPAWTGTASQEEDALGTGTLSIPLHPPDDAGHVAVTLIFRETQDQTLSLTWQSANHEEPVVVAENLIEALDGAENQRTIVLNRTLFGTGGILRINYSSPEIAPKKVVLEWVEPYPVYTRSGGEVPALISAAGRPVDSLAGAPFVAPPDKLDGNVADATLLGDAEPLDAGLAVEASLTAPVRGVRVYASVLNLPWNAHVSLFINGTYIGNMELEVPGLSDPGYNFKDDKISYAGWRNATLSVSGTAFKPGANTITFAATTPDAKTITADATYLRDGRLQLLYEPNTP